MATYRDGGLFWIFLLENTARVLHPKSAVNDPPKPVTRWVMQLAKGLGLSIKQLFTTEPLADQHTRPSH
jgi:hypothetical protein